MSDDPQRPPHEAALAALRERHPGLQTFTFGDSRRLCDELMALVRSGAKTATCGALREYEEEGAPLPVPGGRAVALDWDGRTALVIETAEIRVLRFDAVDEAFALEEGEGTFEDWRDGHRRYFERNGGFSPDMMLVCERFRLVEDLA